MLENNFSLYKETSILQLVVFYGHLAKLKKSLKLSSHTSAKDLLDPHS